MTEICRTCLREVSENSLLFYLDNADTKNVSLVTVRCKLARCVPELDLGLISNAIICGNCFESLNVAHEFKNKCLEAETRIQNYIRKEGYISTCLDLKKVVQHKEEPPPVALDNQSLNGPIETTVIPLDIKNLQCNTQELFAVPKIAQLLSQDSSYTCDRCPFVALTESDLKVHQKTHMYHHKCNECEYTTPKKQTLIIHMRKHAKEKLFCCTSCNYGTPYRNMLVQHRRTQHSGEGSYKCGLCDFKSIYISALNKHVKTHTRLDDEETVCDLKGRLTDLHEIKVPIDKTKPYKCLFCEYSSSHKTNLGYHMKLHAGITEKLYKCKICNYRAIKKTHLRNHLKAHRQAKCNQCESCIKQHEKEQSYACSFCAYKTSVKMNLVSHLVTHTQKMPEKEANPESSTCVMCKKKFDNVESLKGHVKYHESPSLHLETNGGSLIEDQGGTFLYTSVSETTKSTTD